MLAAVSDVVLAVVLAADADAVLVGISDTIWESLLDI